MSYKTVFVLICGILLAMSATAATAGESYWQKIKDQGRIDVGILVDWPPYDGSDVQGNPQGYDADVSKMLADYYDLKLNFVPVTGPSRIPYLLSDKVDVVIGSLTITPGRKKQVQFSRPYSAAVNVLLAPDSVKISGPKDFFDYEIGGAPCELNCYRFARNSTGWVRDPAV